MTLGKVGVRRRSSPRTMSFLWRLLLTFALANAGVGIVQYVVASQAIEARLVQEGADQSQADARHIERAYAEADGEDPLDEVVEVLAVIAARPRVEHVDILDRAGAVVASTDTDHIGEQEPPTDAEAAIKFGRLSAGTERHDGEDGVILRYVSPVELPTGRFALEVAQDKQLLDRQLSDLRRRTFGIVLLGTVLGAPLFYLLGGRSLSVVHESATEAATTDGLTGIANYRAFQSEIRRAIAHARRTDAPLSVALLDLDEFKPANDRMGHHFGDQILSEFAALLSSGRADDRAFRLGGDEFALLVGSDEISSIPALERVRADAQQRLAPVTVSIGVASLQQTSEADELIQQADAALYEAKRRGRNTVVAFGEISGALHGVSPTKVRAVRRLLDENALEIVFQPIIDLDRDAILGVEALMRPHEELGLTGPLEAFEVADRIGHSQELDRLCRTAALGRVDELPRDALLFVNIAPRGLRVDEPEVLAAEVRAAGLDPDRVVLEIAERTTVPLGALETQVKRLKELGFRLALDDVGEGNAGLAMLRRLPLDFVKVAQSVVAGAADDPATEAVLVAIVAFARRAGAYVIAEGIESPSVFNVVRNVDTFVAIAGGIQGGQGFFLGPPASSIPAMTSRAAAVEETSSSGAQVLASGFGPTDVRP